MPRVTSTIYDTENEFDWASITSTYIDGALAIEQKTMDTGFGEWTWYRDGYVSSFQLRDSPENTNDWDILSTAFNADGEIIAEYINYDDGRYVQQNITDGVVTSEIISFPETGAANELVRLSTIYSDGEVVRTFGTYSNGTSYQDEFTDGVRDTRYWSDRTTDGTDGAKPWTSITLEYDVATGDLIERQTFNDDGTSKTELFEGGVRSSTAQLDNFVFNSDVPPADGGAKAWQEINTTFDENGVISNRETTFDNGVQRLEFFEDGNRLGIIEEDVLDFAGWDVRMTVYDTDGNVSQRAVSFDNADETYRLYEGGQLLGRLDLDGNDSNTWEARLTEYPADGPIVTTYDNMFDVPEPYLDFLELGVA